MSDRRLGRRIAGLAAAAGIAFGWLGLAPAGAVAAPPAGPPYPSPITGQRVYDYANIFSPAARANAEATSYRIEQRTGAQVAVYTQVKPQSDTPDKANADARALMDQWGVGRKGFDDGLVILFDMQANRIHGQASLYAGSGFRSAYLTNAERQSIFDNDMLPRLKAQDFDGALRAAMTEIDAAATPEHAQQLEQARQINAVVGIVGAAIAIWLVMFVVIRWWQHGKDPDYIDDNSILMPAPPDGLTPAMATLLLKDTTSNTTVSAGLVDLAARGIIGFREEPRPFGSPRAGISLQNREANVAGPEGKLFWGVCSNAGFDYYLSPDSMSGMASDVKDFKSDLERLAVAKGWMAGIPSHAIALWTGVGVAEIALGAGLLWWTGYVEASGGLLGGFAFVLAGLVTVGVGQVMPTRTKLGSMLHAMLAAYKRTLQLTMAKADSMGQVVQSKALPWVTKPDEIMAWGVAFGLHGELEDLMQRQLAAPRTAGTWMPGWWGVSGGGHGFLGGGGHSGGLFSASAVPDFGSMFSALGSIGSSASHSGGGSFGGGGGGGGGGAGGGF